MHCAFDLQVGAYGTVDKETGVLRVEGNIYDEDFKKELEKHGVNIDMAKFPPQDGPIEQDFIVASRGAKHRDLNVDTKVCVAALHHDVTRPDGVQSQECPRHCQCIRQRTVALHARKARRSSHHAQPSSNLHSTQRGTRTPLQSGQTYQQVARHKHSRVPRVHHVPLRHV